MSREALSLEISQVVSRLVSGEPIDPAARGAMLAQKFPELGMSGEMIGEAIVRAASMVGTIKSTPLPAAWTDRARASATVTGAGDANGAAAKAASSLPAQSAEDDLTSTIDAEIGSLLSGRALEPMNNANGQTSAGPARATEARPWRSGPLAALRAFFRH